MGILIQFLRDMRHWERATRLSFWLAFGLQLALLAALVIGRDRVPSVALIGVVVLGMMVQGIALIGNRHLVTAYTRAQQAFRNGEFAEARRILEQHIEAQRQAHKRVAADVYVLLGNTLRNLGDLESSERVLQMIVKQQPESPFALYGLGRTLLAQGNWEGCSEIITKSLSFGAPRVVAFDLGYARVAAGHISAGRQVLQDILPELTEPYRRLMAHELLGSLGTLTDDQHLLVRDGTGYWEREASLFAHTPYGQQVQTQLAAIYKQVKS